jgi:hypothetical protein
VGNYGGKSTFESAGDKRRKQSQPNAIKCNYLHWINFTPKPTPASKKKGAAALLRLNSMGQAAITDIPIY